MVRYKLKQDSKFTGFEKGAAFSIGGHLRARDALALSVLYEFSQYSIGVSYDVNTSRLAPASNLRGGMEVSLRFVNPSPFKRIGSGKARF
jgi:hypothetical protein